MGQREERAARTNVPMKQGDDACGDGQADDGRSCGPEAHGEVAIPLSSTQAEHLHASQALIDALQQSIDALRQHGAIQSIVHLENEVRKERRRQRNVCGGDAAVAAAMQRLRDKESLEGIRQRRAAAELNSQRKNMTDLKKEAAEANQLFKKRKQEILDKESLLASSYALKIV